MHEHVAQTLYYFGVHLLYASIVWGAAWLLTSILRGSATAKYWIWVATSLNFILPVGAVLDKTWSRHLLWATPLGAIGDAGASIAENTNLAFTLGTIWLLGATLMLTRLCLRIQAEHRRALAEVLAAPDQSAVTPHWDSLAGIPVQFAPTRQTPAVDGVLRPHICLPRGIERLLNTHELNAVLIHELAHAKRRDNLIRLVHELGLSVLWFHPLVWITGSRLSLYRELSCDESVMRNARGEDLVSALAKLANPEEPLLLQASASSFLRHRLARLTAPAQRPSFAANTAMTVVFGMALLAGVFGTVAHTACCFVHRSQVHRGQIQVPHACPRT